MDYIRVTTPGKYKRVKVEEAGRECSCGTKLSIYNSESICSPCNRKNQQNMEIN